MNQRQHQDRDCHQPAENHVGPSKERLRGFQMYCIVAYVRHCDGAHHQGNEGEDEAWPEERFLRALATRFRVRNAEFLVTQIADGQEARHQHGAENEIGIVFRRVPRVSEGREADVCGQQRPNDQERDVRGVSQSLPDHEATIQCWKIQLCVQRNCQPPNGGRLVSLRGSEPGGQPASG